MPDRDQKSGEMRAIYIRRILQTNIVHVALFYHGLDCIMVEYGGQNWTGEVELCEPDDADGEISITWNDGKCSATRTFRSLVY